MERIARMSMLTGLLFAAFTAAADPSTFAGTWNGKGTYILAGDLYQCSFTSFSFEGGNGSFTFAKGRRECDKHQEDFYRVTMTYRDGKLYFNNMEVGSYTANTLEARYRMPDNGSFRNWRMFMRREGNHLMYEESRTMEGETTPLISFAGMQILDPNSVRKPLTGALPTQPTDQNHPGSAVYAFQVVKETKRVNGRQVDVFLPQGAKNAPVVVFGHGQAISVEGYELTFQHLARKGVAVIHPMYDKGFFDQDWRRMAQDYATLTQETIKLYGDKMDANQVFFSGHSKGAYIALMAGTVANPKPRAMVLFAPAGYDAEYLTKLQPEMPVTLVWGEADSVITRSSIEDIYQRLPSQRKQFIVAKSYSSLSADHYFPMSKSFFFGGRDGISPFHFHGTWKWLLGATWDAAKGANVTEPFLYGSEAATTGVDGLSHLITRSW